MSALYTAAAWRPIAGPPAFSADALVEAAADPRRPLAVVRDARGRLGVGVDGEVVSEGPGAWPLVALLPPLYPEWLGDRSFGEAHGTRLPYVAGEMANGIASADMVIALAQAGLLGFFGAAGLSPRRVAENVARIAVEAQGGPWGVNLIHSPAEPDTEEAVADLLIREGVRRVCASAFLGLTRPVVRLALSGVRRDANGAIHRNISLFAKISRPELAQMFLSPAPRELVDALVARGQLTAEEAALARHLPLAEDITVEADSGGHTDNRPLPALFPAIAGLAAQIVREQGYSRPVRVGAAGGLGTPDGVAGAFALGAAYVLTGSVNQAAIESGLSDAGRAMLATAGIADVAMAPAADMFEIGVKLQVLKRGTLFAQRAQRLYDLYVAYDDIDAIPSMERQKIERDIFRAPLEQIWEETRRFFAERNPAELARAEQDGKRKMALIFRWYLGLSSRWAIEGRADRRMDYQIWCGPAMGAFNAWTQGTFLEDPARREVVQIALNLMEGATVLSRVQQLRALGVPMPAAAFQYRPRPLD